MKNLLIVLASLSLVACAEGSLTNFPNASQEPQESDIDLSGSQGDPIGGFDCPTNYSVAVVDGQKFLVSIPSICESDPSVWRYDPGPDGHYIPVNNELKQEILNTNVELFKGSQSNSKEI